MERESLNFAAHNAFMKVKICIGFGLAILSGCAPTVWVKPGATEADFNVDRARCQLMAEGENPNAGVPYISTGKVGTDVAANLGAALVSGIAQGAAIDHTFDLCMQHNGYLAQAPGTSVSPPPTTSYATAANPSPGPPPPPVIAASQPVGRVVLFPVMIYNEYYPEWTVDVVH